VRNATVLIVAIVVVCGGCATTREMIDASPTVEIGGHQFGRVVLSNDTAKTTDIFLGDAWVARIHPHRQALVQIPLDQLVTLSFRVAGKSVWIMDLVYDQNSRSYPYDYRGQPVKAFGAFDYDE